MERYEMLERIKTPRGKGLVQNEAWRRVRKGRGVINRYNGYNIYNEDYWGLIERVMVDYNTGEEREKGSMNDEKMLEKIMEDYDMDKEKTTIMFTDGSKTTEGKAVGAAMIHEGEEEGHYISMDKRCTVFTAEACAIAIAIMKWTINKDKGKGKGNLII